MPQRVELGKMRHGTEILKRGFAKMQEGGVVMDVVTPEQAHIAEDSGAVSVMALERVPADIRSSGGVARMSHPKLIKEIIETTSIPVMAKARIGHDEEARVLESLGVDMVDESEVLTPADNEFHINKWEYKMPFVCGATNLGEALRRIGEGASMIRTKGEAGTGDVVQAVTHARQILSDIKKIQRLDDEELMTEAKNLGAPYELVCEVKNTGKLPVVNFAAGGIATPADAALLMQIGVEGIFVGSGIFKSGNPSRMADAIVQATTHYEDAELIAEISKNLGGAMKGDEVSKLDPSERLEKRGW